MSEFLEQIRALISAGEIRISDHGYDELAEDRLTAREVVAGIAEAMVVEEYPDYPKGPSILLLQKEQARLFMLYGAFPGAMTDRPSWSLLTGRTLSGGTKVSCGGDNDEAADEN